MTFAETLAAWLPEQRWFAGKGTPIDGLAVAAQITLVAGDPGLRHVIVDVTQATGTDSYQLYLGLRADLPGSLEHVRIGPADGDLIGYDGLHDPSLTAVLLEAMAGGTSVGPLSFAHRPGIQIDTGLQSLVLTGEQSNTSLLFGEDAILKVFRRLSPGPNPDLEVPDALASLGSRHVAAPLGWVTAQSHGAAHRARGAVQLPAERGGRLVPGRHQRPRPVRERGHGGGAGGRGLRRRGGAAG